MPAADQDLRPIEPTASAIVALLELLAASYADEHDLPRTLLFDFLRVALDHPDHPDVAAGFAALAGPYTADAIRAQLETTLANIAH